MKFTLSQLKSLIREEVIDARHRFGKKKQPSQNPLAQEVPVVRNTSRLRGLKNPTGKPVHAVIDNNDAWASELKIDGRLVYSSDEDNADAIDFLVRCIKFMREHHVTTVTDSLHAGPGDFFDDVSYDEWFNVVKERWGLTQADFAKFGM